MVEKRGWRLEHLGHVGSIAAVADPLVQLRQAGSGVAQQLWYAGGLFDVVSSCGPRQGRLRRRARCGEVPVGVGLSANPMKPAMRVADATPSTSA